MALVKKISLPLDADFSENIMDFCLSRHIISAVILLEQPSCNSVGL